MDINQVKMEKAVVEGAIKAILETFQDRTGLSVASIELVHYRTLGNKHAAVHAVILDVAI